MDEPAQTRQKKNQTEKTLTLVLDTRTTMCVSKMNVETRYSGMSILPKNMMK